MLLWESEINVRRSKASPIRLLVNRTEACRITLFQRAQPIERTHPRNDMQLARSNRAAAVGSVAPAQHSTAQHMLISNLAVQTNSKTKRELPLAGQAA